MSAKGEAMLQILANLTSAEQKYINAKIIVQYLEEDLERYNPDHPWRDALYIKKQIYDWTEIIQQLESQLHLAQC